MKYFKTAFLHALIIFLLGIRFINAKEVPPLTGPVIDEAGILSASTKSSFESILRSFHKKNGPQIQLYIAKSLEGETIEGHSIKVVDEWKLGDEKKDDGVLFLIAMKDKKMRIEVGQGLEGSLTDLKAGRIVDHLKVYFKKGEYEKGIYIGLSLIVKVLGGDIKEIPKVRRSRGYRKTGEMQSLGDFLPLVFIILFIIISSFRRNRFSYFGSHYSGGFSGGGFSGGGFSSGGSWGGSGGGFSGGGASGGW